MRSSALLAPLLGSPWLAQAHSIGTGRQAVLAPSRFAWGAAFAERHDLLARRDTGPPTDHRHLHDGRHDGRHDRRHDNAQPPRKLAVIQDASGNPAVAVTPVPGLPSEHASEHTPLEAMRCNGYAEFCGRSYSDVAMVGAHNAPFVRARNLAANQERPVAQQLDDGVRFLQGQMHWPRGSTTSSNSTTDADTEPHFCHTLCDLLDAGPVAVWLGEVRQWLDAHPTDVVTVLLGNGNYSDPEQYVPAIRASGLDAYAYVPPAGARGLADWPTLGDMVRANTRAVLFLDYKADEARFPWLLDQFAYLWETPFDPVLTAAMLEVPGEAVDEAVDETVDETRACVVQRPPDLAPERARSSMYIMNHNLNVEFSVVGQALMVPAVALSAQTNAATGRGSLGEAARRCQDAWGRPPLVLNVDYYNRGTPDGSVFQVAAALNGVVYNGTCCNAAPVTSASVRRVRRRVSSAALVALAAWTGIVLW